MHCAFYLMYLCFLEFVYLFLLEKTVSRTDIECPRDTVTYNCLINSKVVDPLYLRWTVSVPGLNPMIVTYDNTSDNSSNLLVMNIYSRLVRYESGEIESTIVFSLLQTINGTTLECGITGLDRDILTVFVNNSAGIM